MANAVKEQFVKDLNDKFHKTKSAVFADFKGLTVGELTDLRNQLRSESVDLQIVKNTLAKRAAEGTSLEPGKDFFIGPTAVAMSFDDLASPARIMVEYEKNEPKLKVKGGTVEGRSLSYEDVKILADLPSREVLLGKLLAAMNGPATNFVGVLGGVIRKLLYVLKDIEGKKGK